METLVALNREQGVTIIVVTHEPISRPMRTGSSRCATARSCPMKRTRQPDHEPVARRLALRSPSALFQPRGRRADEVDARAARLAFGLMIIAVPPSRRSARNKLRSALTMLGVFIGVAALIAMVAVGQGANEAVRKQIESLGTNLLVVLPGATTAGGVRAGFGSASTLTVTDAEAIRREDAAVGQVSYLIRQTGQVAVRQSELDDQRSRASAANYPPITNWQIAAGRAHVGRRRKRGRAGRADRPNGRSPALRADEIPSAPRSWSKACRCA